MIKDKNIYIFIYTGQLYKQAFLRAIEERQRQKKMQRSSLLFGGTNLFNSFLHLLFCTGRFELYRMQHVGLEETDKFILFFKIVLGEIASAARN